MNKIRTDDTTAWCPNCFDACEVTQNMNNDNKIESFEYECCGCDKVFILQELRQNVE